MMSSQDAKRHQDKQARQYVHATLFDPTHITINTCVLDLQTMVLVELPQAVQSCVALLYYKLTYDKKRQCIATRST